MFRKSSNWFVLFLSIFAIAFVVSGCAKKRLVKIEETVAKPVVDARKEAPKEPETTKAAEAAAAEKAKEEARAAQAAAAEKAKEEARAAEAAAAEKAKEAAKVEAAKKEETEGTGKGKAKPEAAQAPAATATPAAEILNFADLRIQFAFDDYNISTQAREKLEKMAGWMMKHPRVKIQIEGHTCDIGTAEYNLALGERRANSAKVYLEGLGVSPGNLSTISYGEERPLVPNKNELERSKNRRDEFVEVH